MSGLVTEGRILAMDLANLTGYAWGKLGIPSTLRTSGTISVAPIGNGDKRGRWAQAEAAYHSALNYSEAGVVYYEQPMGVFPSWDATHVLHGLTTILEKVTFARGAELVGIPQPTLKKFATCYAPGQCDHAAKNKKCTGKGNATKEMMIVAAKRRWPEVKDKRIDDNEADALCLLALAFERRGS